MVAQVVLPSNLIQQLTSQPIVSQSLSSGLQLAVAAFTNATLFPSSPGAEVVSSPVIGGLVPGSLSLFNLSDPVYVVLQASESLDDIDQLSSKLEIVKTWAAVVAQR